MTIQRAMCSGEGDKEELEKGEKVPLNQDGSDSDKDKPRDTVSDLQTSDVEMKNSSLIYPFRTSENTRAKIKAKSKYSAFLLVLPLCLDRMKKTTHT